jgi:hypothetical protein
MLLYRSTDQLINLLEAVEAVEAVEAGQKDIATETVLGYHPDYKNYQELVDQVVNYDNNFTIVEAVVESLYTALLNTNNEMTTRECYKLEYSKLGFGIDQAQDYMSSKSKGYVDYLYQGAFKYLKIEYPLCKNYLDEDVASDPKGSSSSQRGAKGTGTTYKSCGNENDALAAQYKKGSSSSDEEGDDEDEAAAAAQYKKGSSSSARGGRKESYDNTYNSDDEDDTAALLLTEVRQDEYFDPSDSSFLCKDGSKDMPIVSWVEDVDFKPEVQDSHVFIDLTLGVALLVLLESH